MPRRPAMQQFNVTLTERYSVAVRQLLIRDEKQIPELLRPVVEEWVDRELLADADLAAAVQALMRSRRRQPVDADLTIE